MPIVTLLTDFGSEDVTSGSVDNTFTIKNTGNADLTLSGTPKVAIPNGLLFPALLQEVEAAQSSIQIMTSTWRTDYAQPTRATEFFDAVVRAHQQRNVEVFAVLNYSRFEPDVALQKGVTG